MRQTLIFILVSLWASAACAVLKIDITQGNIDPMPIAIGEFFINPGVTGDMGDQIRKVIENDLRNSGLFRPIDKSAFLEMLPINKTPTFISWRQIGALALTSGQIAETSDKITLNFQLWDPTLETKIETVSLTLPKTLWRRGAHRIADRIYKRLTGEDGYFESRVVFVAESGPLTKRVKRLAIMDQDGANYKELTDGKELTITPRFDPKAHRVIYMSFKNKVPQIYMLDINTGSQRLLGNFPGMSFAPRFAPDNNSAILSVAKGGSTDIYEINLDTNVIHKLTSGAGSINTSPSYSPDGSKIVFTSDRGGKEQLYIMNRDGSGAKRISFGDGNYSTPVWSPRGDFIAFTKSKPSIGQFYIGVMRPDGSGERMLTASWMDEGPTWSPNGRVIMFARQSKGAGYRIYSVDVTGHNERLVDTPMDASDPAWSPLLG